MTLNAKLPSVQTTINLEGMMLTKPQLPEGHWKSYKLKLEDWYEWAPEDSAERSAWFKEGVKYYERAAEYHNRKANYLRELSAYYNDVAARLWIFSAAFWVIGIASWVIALVYGGE